MTPPAFLEVIVAYVYSLRNSAELGGARGLSTEQQQGNHAVPVAATTTLHRTSR